MFRLDHKKLRVSFNAFHDISDKDMPETGEYCLIELKDGTYTAGEWWQSGDGGRPSSGYFCRGTADSVDSKKVVRWHYLANYDLMESLEDEKVNWINLGPEEEGERNVQFDGFKVLADEGEPENEQFCLLIMKNGRLAAGRWKKWRQKDGGSFIYSSALASHSADKVWAWTALGSDEHFEAELKRKSEKKREEELNKNPSADPELFKYGMDINVYYEKALEKLREEYSWATLPMLKKAIPLWQIAPLHGKYVFGKIEKNYYDDSDIVNPWTDGSTADEFIDHLCEYTRYAVRNSDPGQRFKYGTDINVYLDKAFENVKKDYRWLEKDIPGKMWVYDIRKVKGNLEFVRRFRDDKTFSVYDAESAEQFIEWLEHDYQNEALRINPAVASYEPKFGHIELNGWNLEKYVFYKLKTGDYKVSVTAGDRVAGGSRDFFITPYCFEAETYEEFLDRYLEIVPAYAFGLGKEELLPDEKLKKFLGY